MANPKDFEQVIETIREKWENPPARNGHYKSIPKSVTIKNLRKMSVNIEFRWPVCAIGGINGSGKSTVLQMCSAAYSQSKGGRYFKIGDWVRAALTGETPAVSADAVVGYSFHDETTGYQVPHTPARRRWQYPTKAPLRNVEFIGISDFAPRIERRDRVHAFRSRLEVKKKERLSDEVGLLPKT